MRQPPDGAWTLRSCLPSLGSAPSSDWACSIKPATDEPVDGVYLGEVGEAAPLNSGEEPARSLVAVSRMCSRKAKPDDSPGPSPPRPSSPDDRPSIPKGSRRPVHRLPALPRPGQTPSMNNRNARPAHAQKPTKHTATQKEAPTQPHSCNAPTRTLDRTCAPHTAGAMPWRAK